MSSIRTLKTFLAVVHHGSFAAAGKAMGLTPAAVGLQIRALEEQLNQVLFDRGARTIVLNTAGRRMIPQVEELVRRFETLVVTPDPDELSGTVVVGALVSVLMGAFADALWSLKQQHPRLEVKLFAGLSSDFVRDVEQGRLDAGVITQPPHPLPASLVWTPLYTEPMVLIVPRHPHFALAEAPLDILAQAPFIRFDQQTWTGYLVSEVLKECQVTVRDEMELNSVEAIVAIVSQGFGVSIVPRLANVEWEKDERLELIPLPCREIKRHVGLIERSHHHRQAFTQAIQLYFQRGGGVARKASGSI